MIALLPQIAVPAPISTLVPGLSFNMRPKIQAEAMAAVMVTTMIAKARQPTAVALAKLRLAPVRTMVRGIARRTPSFAPWRIFAERQEIRGERADENRENRRADGPADAYAERREGQIVDRVGKRGDAD